MPVFSLVNIMHVRFLALSEVELPKPSPVDGTCLAATLTAFPKLTFTACACSSLLRAEKVISSIYLVNTMDKATYLSAALVVVLLAMSVTLSTIAQQQQLRTNGQTSTTTSTQIVNFTQLFEQK